MELTEEAIKEYQSIMLADYGVSITRDEAIATGKNLIGLYEVLFGLNDSLPKNKNIIKQKKQSRE